MDLADVVGGHKPRRVSVRLCPDNELAVAYAEARHDLEQAVKQSTSLDGTATGKAREAVAELQKAVEDASVEFTLQSIGRAAWTKLRDKHQPSKAQREQYRQVGQILDHNPDTFPQAAIAASLIEPVAESAAETVALVNRIWDEWTWGECERLWNACLEANLGALTVPKQSTASVKTRTTGQNSESPETQGSPEASSTDGGSLAG